jgi:hypothetical protein
VMLGIRKPPERLEPSGQVLVSCLDSLLLTATCGVVRLVIMHDGPVAYIGAIIGTAALTWNAVVWVIERRTKASVCGGYSRAGIVIRVVNRCSHQIQVVSVGATDEVDDASYFADVSGNMKLYGIRIDDPLEVVEGAWRHWSVQRRKPSPQEPPAHDPWRWNLERVAPWPREGSLSESGQLPSRVGKRDSCRISATRYGPRYGLDSGRGWQEVQWAAVDQRRVARAARYLSLSL